MECPSCKKNVEISERNFGALFTCPDCQSVYFVNFDGQPEYGEIAPINFVTEPADATESTDENPIFNENNETYSEAVSPTFSEVGNSFSSVASEIEQFGNKELQVSGLSYNLRIENIDDKQTMQVIKEAISDPKFGWDEKEILKTINSGFLEIHDLSPVQAYILAKRIQFIDAEMKWSQNVLA